LYIIYALQEKKKSNQKEHDPRPFQYTEYECDKKKKDAEECRKKTGEYFSVCTDDGVCAIFGPGR